MLIPYIAFPISFAWFNELAHDNRDNYTVLGEGK
jgi:hypothetical protein